MRNDHRPYRLKRALRRVERAYVNHFLRPQLESLGPDFMFMKPWNIELNGPGIHIGNQVHIVTTRDRRVRLTAWRHEAGEGRIDVGDYTLICPGVRIDSATAIEIGAGTMIASGAYLTDADWHDIYDRTRAIGATAAIRLAENTWIGDRATVLKGVTVGRNSVVGTGAVVTRDVPDNVVVAGNPAVVVRTLDAGRALRTREMLLADADGLDASLAQLERYLLGGNTLGGWLRTVIRPQRGD